MLGDELPAVGLPRFDEHLQPLALAQSGLERLLQIVDATPGLLLFLLQRSLVFLLERLLDPQAFRFVLGGKLLAGLAAGVDERVEPGGFGLALLEHPAQAHALAEDLLDLRLERVALGPLGGERLLQLRLELVPALLLSDERRLVGGGERLLQLDARLIVPATLVGERSLMRLDELAFEIGVGGLVANERFGQGRLVRGGQRALDLGTRGVEQAPLFGHVRRMRLVEGALQIAQRGGLIGQQLLHGRIRPRPAPTAGAGFRPARPRGRC